MANVIGFDPVAFSIDGGRHPASLLRRLAYTATAGSRGVVQPGDLKVTQTTTSSTQVAISIGAGVIPVGESSVDDQSYIVTAGAQSLLDIDATSGAARQDMVVVRIYDPEFSNENNPPTAGDAPNWQYVRPEIIKGVPAGTQSFEDLDLPWSALELARIEIPPNTTNITTGMIKDLRQLALPREKTVIKPQYLLPAQILTTVTPSWQNFPAQTQTIAVPKWATHAYVMINIAQLYGQPNSTSEGDFIAVLGDQTGPGVTFKYTDTTQNQHTAFVSAELSIAHLAGTTQTLKMQGRRHHTGTGSDAGTSTGQVAFDQFSQVVFQVTFVERTV